MKQIFFFSIFLFVLSACNNNPKSPSSSSIIGKWRVVNIIVDEKATTQAEKEALSSFSEQMKMFKEVADKMPLELTFFDDNSFTFGAMLFKMPGTYKLSGDELTLEMKNVEGSVETNGKKQSGKLIVEQPDAKHLHLKAAGEKGALELERVE